MPAYEHRQMCPQSFMAAGVGVAVVVVGVLLDRAGVEMALDYALLFLFVATTAALALAAVALYLCVADQGDHLTVEFGPFRWGRTCILYDDMVSVAETTVASLDRWQARDGQPVRVYAARKGPGVQVTLRRTPGTTVYARRIIIGTDERDELLAFLLGKVTPEPPEA